MSTGISKRALSAGVAVGALAFLTQGQRASAQTPFTSFPFAAKGASHPRTMPDRLADIINVKDFGAKGDNLTNDQPAIQNAVNWTTSRARGLIFFPPGIYKVNAPIDLSYIMGSDSLQHSFVMTGCGDQSRIIGNFNDFIIKRSPGTYNRTSGDGSMVIENLTVANGNVTNPLAGAIQIYPQVGTLIANCRISGGSGIVLTGGEDPQNPGNYMHVFTATVMNCSIKGAGKSSLPGISQGVGLSMGQGTTALGNDIAGWKWGIKCFGVANQILGGRCEVCDIGIKTNEDHLGNHFSQSGFVLQGMSFESNDITLDMSSGTVNAVVEACPMVSVDGHGIDGIVLSSATGTRITLISIQVNGGWSGYGIRCPFNGAATASRTFIGVNASNVWDSSRNWEMPAIAAGGRWINCNNPDPVFTFANLPSGGLLVRNKGDEYMISDSPIAMSGNFGTTVSAGGGANLVKVRWNGSNWVIC
jgi:hypothetical protein